MKLNKFDTFPSSLHDSDPLLIESIMESYALIFESNSDIIGGKSKYYWLNTLIKNGVDEEWALTELNCYIDHLHQADKGNFFVYRVILADDIESINTTQLGEHFTYLPPTDLINYAEGDGEKYVVKCLTKPNSVDYEKSLYNFTQLPDENEMNFTTQPEIYKISKLSELD